MLTTYLKKVPLFRHLKESQLREIASRCQEINFGKGRVLFRKTDMGTDLFVVKTGALKAVLEDEEGGEIVLAQFQKGDFFGELSLLDGKGRSATIVAESDAELFVLNKDVFIDILSRDPKIAIEVMTTLVERLRKADEMIESLAFYEVGERLVRILLDGASPESAEKGFLRTAKMTHRELASHIGSSREAVSKCMKTLALKQIVKEGRGCILVAVNALDLLKKRESAT